ncbi:hypothetical protein E2562_010903 [Oryza meyeriana var. granulata]|uniref:Uncharacterized protein n=1 Tax=Oryza meyeriana var. granulata TaxID=110450 RepID=A0A6G1BVE7_9ORYZ|nr:hypothetical protein E2562_010903 [Oryza meyeriana var. granulata]
MVAIDADADPCPHMRRRISPAPGTTALHLADFHHFRASSWTMCLVPPLPNSSVAAKAERRGAWCYFLHLLLLGVLWFSARHTPSSLPQHWPAVKEYKINKMVKMKMDLITSHLWTK